MQIYTRQTLDQCVWPATPDGDYARRVLSALVEHGTRRYLANVAATVHVVQVGSVVMPLVVVDAAPATPNAYVCSPTTHYLDYARREIELELADHAVLRRVLPPLLESLRPLLRATTIERIVYVNNWLLSTNLYPPLDSAALQALRDGLLKAFPDHTIVFRSLNHPLNGDTIVGLERLGFARVFSRQVYLLDPRDRSYRRRNNYKHDQRLARHSPYRWLAATDLAPALYGRLRDLYDDLYVQKYSVYNPQFTTPFIAQALEENWMRVGALVRDGCVDGVLGFVERHGVMTAPLVGYDRSCDPALGLYRLLMLRLSDAAAERGQILHLSSGAAAFKRLRGGEPALEYSLVYHKHLSPRRQAPWRLLSMLSRAVVIPLMQRYGL